MKKGDVDIPQHKPGNMAENSMGGTELLTMELFKRLPEEYKDYFQFVISRLYELEDKPRLYWIHDLALDPVHTFLTENNGISNFAKLSRDFPTKFFDFRQLSGLSRISGNFS